MKITKALNKKVANKIRAIVDEINDIAENLDSVEDGETTLAEDLWNAQSRLDSVSQDLEQGEEA